MHPLHTRSEDIPEYYFEERAYIKELLNSADIPGISVAQARVEPGVTTVLHLVEGSVELYYILAGTGDMFIDGKHIGRVKAGDLIRIPAGLPQQITNTGATDLIFLAICSPRFEPHRYVVAE